MAESSSPMISSKSNRNEQDDGVGGDASSASSVSRPQAQSVGGSEHSSKESTVDEQNPVRVDKKDQNGVVWGKRLVCLFLMVAAFTVGGLTYFLVRRQQDHEFRSEFELMASQFLALADEQMKTKLSVLDSLSQSITSYANHQDKNKNANGNGNSNVNETTVSSVWPFVTVPDFEVRTAQVRRMAKIDWIGWAPLIQKNQQEDWAGYVWQNQGWITQGLTIRGISPYVDPGTIIPIVYDYSFGHTQSYLHDEMPYETDPVLQNLSVPIWQIGPAPTNATIVNLNLMSDAEYRRVARHALLEQRGVVSRVIDLSLIKSFSLVPDSLLQSQQQKQRRQLGGDTGASATVNKATEEVPNPTSFAVTPIFNQFSPLSSNDSTTHTNSTQVPPRQTVVGFVNSIFSWQTFLENILPTKDAILRSGNTLYMADGTAVLERRNHARMILVLDDTCQYTCSFQVEILGETQFLGLGDKHNTRFDDMKISTTLSSLQNSTPSCQYTLAMYPTNEFHHEFNSNRPLVYMMVVILVFFFTAMVFLLYDYSVERRQYRLEQTAAITQAIVTSLFPEQVQKRILEDAQNQETGDKKWNNLLSRKGSIGETTTKASTSDRIHAYMDTNDTASQGAVSESSADQITGKYRTAPIADLFPSVTIMFADIVGFTAWSSTREPTQVFTLLETLYHAFDEIAGRRRVFKVETIGDCYVAVCGLPDPRPEHAVVMARFARDCLFEFSTLTKELETELGPDTGELGLRVGLHSGQVTAGVLRGERARFQLFGETVNTTARIESTGKSNKIHASHDTAELLLAARKGHWITPRAELVREKGKEELKTFWLDLDKHKSSNVYDGTASTLSGSSSGGGSGDDSTIGTSSHSGADSDGSKGSGDDDGDNSVVSDVSLEQRSRRPSVMLANKNNRLVNWNVDILSRLLREIVARREAVGTKPESVDRIRKMEQHQLHRKDDTMVLDEVKEIVALPDFHAQAAQKQRDPSSVVLDPVVVDQLRNYIRTLSNMYRDNPFHNFEHASHVTMSVVKLLSRIVAPNIRIDDHTTEQSTLHDHTYGITSDPLTQFAVVLSALIHDADHPGVPNAQLVKEQTAQAAVYKNKSIAEQHSVDIAWRLLMGPTFSDLRRVIYTTESEFKRFRQLVVNTVMATDIMDKDLGALRKSRWEKAFSDQVQQEDERSIRNRKATIVIEHLIQASDVAHTMQHWHIYRKWNMRFFEEMYKAYRAGRAEKNPAEFWFQGEIGFFDFYIIPLAKKLKDCGVFGVSSDEYLDYANRNRQEWEQKGAGLVAEMMETMSLLHG